MIFDTNEKGLHTLYKPYQVIILEHIWDLNKKDRIGINSSQAYNHQAKYPEKKSRAAVIYTLNDMVDDGILEYEEKSGKGGYHKVYFPKMNRDEFALFVYNKITAKLDEVFPRK